MCDFDSGGLVLLSDHYETAGLWCNQCAILSMSVPYPRIDTSSHNLRCNQSFALLQGIEPVHEYCSR
jgi:hypothetical protein